MSFERYYEAKWVDEVAAGRLVRQERDSARLALRALIKAVEAERDAQAYERIGGREASSASFAVDDAIDRALEALGDPPIYGPDRRPAF